MSRVALVGGPGVLQAGDARAFAVLADGARLVWRWSGWPFRRPAWSAFVVVAGLIVRGVFGHPFMWSVLSVGWWLPATVAEIWSRWWPTSFERCLAGPSRRRVWKRWAHRKWRRLCRDCGLSNSQQVERRQLNGHKHTVTAWSQPRLIKASSAGSVLTLVVGVRWGQTVDHLEDAAPALRDAAKAHSVRCTMPSPGVVRFDLVMREALADIADAVLPVPDTASDPLVVRMGRLETGAAWQLSLAARHTLIAGCSGAGKGSLIWGVVAGLAPAITAGTVRVYAVDLKYGVELGIGQELFARVATTEEEAVELLQHLSVLMDRRGRAMFGHSRTHVPSAADPTVVLVIDELAALTAYIGDRGLKRQADGLLRSILTKGRVLGVLVVGALQDPAKETVPMRGLFTQTIALRLRSREEVTMVLGEGMTHLAPAHRIPAEAPGTGYVLAEDGSTVKVRADYWSDDLVRGLATRYPAPSGELGVLTDLEPESEGRLMATVGPLSVAPKARKPRTPRTHATMPDEAAA